MSFSVVLDLWDDAGAERVFRRLEGRADLAPFFADVTRDFLDMERRQFASEGGLTGGWPALSPRYAAWKAIHYPGKGILRRTDRLYDSLTTGPEVHRQTRDELELGTAVDYARFHKRRRPPVPLPPPAAERAEWARGLARLMAEG